MAMRTMRVPGGQGPWSPGYLQCTVTGTNGQRTHQRRDEMKTILRAAEAIRQGKSTPLDLLESCLERISRCDDQVRAWVLVDRPRARAEAEKAQSELKRGYDRGLLHGIPLGIKDIIDVFEWPTACGSRLW